MIGYAKKIEKIIRESAFDKKKKKPGLKFNPRLEPAFEQLGPERSIDNRPLVGLAISGEE